MSLKNVDMTERYILDDQDGDLLRAATALLKKLAAAELLRPAELVKRIEP